MLCTNVTRPQTQVHLLVSDNGGRNVIPDSIKLVAGRTGQEYNVRKNRKGAFGEDHYHAKGVNRNGYLRQCSTYYSAQLNCAVCSQLGVWPMPYSLAWCRVHAQEAGGGY
jgi:hypothetical protein